jgi:predicted transcriptional regulator YheO
VANLVLTDVDRVALDNSKTFARGLADYLGAGFEIALHSLEDLERSVIEIFNGQYSGRSVGAPITDLALEMLGEIERGGLEPRHISYFVVDKRGEKLKSTTIAVVGENDRVVGLLCINFYLSTPFGAILGVFSENQQASTMRDESFVDSAENLVLETLGSIQQAVLLDSSIPFALKNKEVVAQLASRGIFDLKNSVALVADALAISKSTVYMHIRTVTGE